MICLVLLKIPMGLEFWAILYKARVTTSTFSGIWISYSN